MEEALTIALPLIEKYAPQLILDITTALQKKGYTVAQIGAIYAQVKPWEQLGINPNAPVRPEAVEVSPTFSKL